MPRMNAGTLRACPVSVPHLSLSLSALYPCSALVLFRPPALSAPPPSVPSPLPARRTSPSVSRESRPIRALPVLSFVCTPFLSPLIRASFSSRTSLSPPSSSLHPRAPVPRRARGRHVRSKTKTGKRSAGCTARLWARWSGRGGAGEKGKEGEEGKEGKEKERLELEMGVLRAETPTLHVVPVSGECTRRAPGARVRVPIELHAPGVVWGGCVDDWRRCAAMSAVSNVPCWRWEDPDGAHIIQVLHGEDARARHQLPGAFRSQNAHDGEESAFRFDGFRRDAGTDCRAHAWLADNWRTSLSRTPHGSRARAHVCVCGFAPEPPARLLQSPGASPLACRWSSADQRQNRCAGSEALALSRPINPNSRPVPVWIYLFPNVTVLPAVPPQLDENRCAGLTQIYLLVLSHTPAKIARIRIRQQISVVSRTKRTGTHYAGR
ncbi:hypothetical protein FB451DRAFT_1556331 [Mycena latifolia]|nr:hypothetical protein FB451DRAFT_1556331 [Mycena latifolia]